MISTIKILKIKNLAYDSMRQEEIKMNIQNRKRKKNKGTKKKARE